MSWYIEKGPESDVVISSRVRLARNFDDYPFPFRMDSESRQKVLSRAKEAVRSSTDALMKDLLFVDIQSLPPIDRQMMVEKHLISPELAQSDKECGVLISKGEDVSIMINEEDHLRIQGLFSGMQIENAWKLCDRVDSLLEKKINYAFSESYGYLTCCPTNLGTGMRASVMLHLPALTMTGYIRNILEACSKLGITVRGLYGENSEALGNMFQISNQSSLGQAEEEIISNITNITFQVVEHERTLRKELYKQNSHRFEDRIFRSLGLLANARIMSTEECLKLLSDVRIGVDMGIIKGIGIETLNEIMLLAQPATLQKFIGRPLSADERDIARAEMVRKKLSLSL